MVYSYSRPCFVSLGGQEQMISLVIHVDPLRHQFHNVRWNRSLEIPGSAIVTDTAQSHSPRNLPCGTGQSTSVSAMATGSSRRRTRCQCRQQKPEVMGALACFRRSLANILPFSAVEASSPASSSPTELDSPACHATCTILRFG
jgi:hypothetical protein